MTEMNTQGGYRSRAFQYVRSSIDARQAARTWQHISPTAARAFNSSASLADDVATAAMESKKECYIFPTYAKRHYLDAGRERLAIHVNVHGWIFTPAIPGASRRNKYTMLLARSLAGLPALPDPRRANSDPLDEMPASPRVSLSRSAGRWFRRESSDSDSDQNVPDMSPSQPMFAAPPRADTDASLDSTTATSSRLDQLSEMDLRICHDNLNLRMGPFLARPEIGKLVKLRLRIGTYESVHTLRTLDNGHFKSRIALPLDAQHHGEDKVEVSIVDDAEMSASEEVSIIGDQGITVISDMDDTIKHTGITEGVRAAFRNAFVREHEHLEVEGVRQWYKSLKEAGCALSYVSNAPWQLWPSLAKFLEVAQLPTGSVTLKEYSGGMLQSIWEPAAEKKRANVQKIMEEFPQRKFLLIGDSGEQDIELYTELASSGFAKQILGIFIRDVSSMGQGPSATGLSGENFFTAGALDDKIDVRTSQEMQPPQLPQRKTANLIDLSDDTITTPSTSEHMQDLLSLDDSKSSAKQTCETPAVNKKVKPALPPKPSALKRASRDVKPESTEAEEARPSHRPELRRDASSISLLSGLTDRTRKAGAGVLTYYGERRKDEQFKSNVATSH